jgi:plasmid stabilization system protein ParE
MDYKIIISGRAIADLRSIVTHIAKDNPTAAERFGIELIQRAKPLAQFPHLGRVVPEENDENIREIIFKSYRIFYRVNEQTRLIEVIRYWHAARGTPDIPKSWD